MMQRTLARLRPAAQLAAGKPHGTRIRYLGGCKCLKCRMANSNYEVRRAAACRAGRGNAIVDAAPAVDHIRRLGRRGVGYKQVAAAASVPISTVARLLSGARRNIREQSAKRILAVTPAARADGQKIPAGRLWRRIARLLDEGYTKTFLARRLGYATRAIQFRRDRVTVRSDADVARLYRQLMGDQAPPATPAINRPQRKSA